MNAPAEPFLASAAQVDQAAIAPLPNSRKIYVQGSRPDVQVPMRAISPVSYTHLTLPTNREV